MTMKKSLIALAVTGALAAPLSASAAEVYGRVNLGIQSVNDDGVAVYGQDEGLGMKNVSSRFGVQGDEDLGNGLTAIYKYEFSVNARNAGGFAANNRLSYLGLEGDFGTLKLGRVWSAWYNYLGWNTDRSQFWGGPGYYGYPTFGYNVGPTTRSSNTVQYTFGGGGYSSDPFTFTVETQMDPTSAGGRADGASLGTDVDGDGNTDEADPTSFDTITAAAQGTFGPVSINGAYRQAYSDNNAVDAEPSQLGVGARFNTGPFYLGGSFITTDPDVNGASEPEMVEVLGTYDFGNGLSTQLSVSEFDADTANDAGNVTGVFAQVNMAVSSRTNVYTELQRLDVDGGSGSDTTPQVLLVGLGHSF
jgi:predicted porin